MAKFGPFKNAFFDVNGVDLSNHVESLTVNESAAALENHAMGDDTAIKIAGLLDWSIDVTFFQDFAAGSVDATLHPIYSGGDSCRVRCRPDSATVGAGNPMWSGDAYITSYQPMGGAHGDNLMTSVTFSPATNLVRSTS